MTKMFTLDDFFRTSIGLDPWQRLAGEAQNYPPHNIEKINDEAYRLTLAVAGFDREELEVSLHQGVLTIRGERLKDDDASRFLYRGIASREFTRRFKLDANMLVDAVTLDKGLLVIDLVREVPEEQKPKLIPIG